jgi:hypothetical protein
VIVERPTNAGEGNERASGEAWQTGVVGDDCARAGDTEHGEKARAVELFAEEEDTKHCCCSQLKIENQRSVASRSDSQSGKQQEGAKDPSK